MFAWPSNRCSVRVVVLVAILVAINFFPFVRPGFSLTKLVLSVGETNISGVSSLTPIDPTIDPTINPTRLEIGFLTVTSTESPNFLARSFEAIFYQSSEGVSSSTLGDTTLRSDPTVSFGTPKVDSGSEQATNPGLATATEGPDSDEEPDSNEEPEEPERPAAVSGWSAVGPAAKYHQLGFTPPQPNFVKNPWPVNVAIRNSCCYSGIRCQKAAPRYSIYVSSNGDRIYAPLISTAVAGLRQRSSECRYEVKQFVETGREQRGKQFKSVNFQAVQVRAGDVWIHVGKILQWEFFRYCQSVLAQKQVYCILYQNDPWDVLTSPGVCEIWEYTYGNIPSAPVVRTLPAGFLPLWEPEQNDREAMRRISKFNVGKIEWVFMGHLVRGNRRKCWRHLRRMPELRHVKFTNHISGFEKNDWKNLAMKHNVVFLNMHKYCNASNSYDRLETVRLSSVLSFGALMISEPVNEVDTEIFKDIVIFEKNLFHSYSDWSPQLKDLLRDSAKIIAFQRRAYALYKEKFEPGRLFSDAGVWDTEQGPNCTG